MPENTNLKLLIVGGQSDPNTARIAEAAQAEGIEHLFWDTDSPDCLNLAWDFTLPDIDLGEHRLRPEAIYMRWNVFGGDADRNIAVYDAIQAYAFAWPDITILNRASVCDNNNKSMNLRLAIELGFAVPETLVLANLAPLQTMPNAESKIVKPLNGGAHTQSVAKFAAPDQDLSRNPPQFVQDRLDGENLRLFSIGGQLSCYHLRTSELDYRDDGEVDVVQVDVPESVIEPTRELVRRKAFDYCALDFRCRRGMEEPVFLEVNSFPMFVRFDDAGNGCLSKATLDFLCGTRAS